MLVALGKCSTTYASACARITLVPDATTPELGAPMVVLDREISLPIILAPRRSETPESLPKLDLDRVPMDLGRVPVELLEDWLE